MRSMNKKLYGLIFVGVMAAIIYVATMFLRVEIPTPTGPTNIKTANIICLLAGILFGGVYGGLSAGIGSVLFDLTNPIYFTSAPTTFINFFLMGFVCGIITNGVKGDKKPNARRILVGAVSGALTYWLLYNGKNVLEHMILNGAFTTPDLISIGAAAKIAAIASSTKMITSGINAVVASVFATLLGAPARAALRKAGLMERIGRV